MMSFEKSCKVIVNKETELCQLKNSIFLTHQLNRMHSTTVNFKTRQGNTHITQRCDVFI